MPVFAEIVENPAEQDRKDLCKIYGTPADQFPPWLEEAIDGDSIVIAGRFNGRLLGALCLKPIGEGHYRLEKLQVRDITRRRGVARQLLKMALRDLPMEVRRIDVELGEHPELENLFSETGFEAEGERRFSWTSGS